MKPTLFLALGSSLALVSCTTVDPEYDEYKKQKEAEQAAPGTYGGTDPYGTSTTNPYGVPSATPGTPSDVGRYTPQNSPPYQPLPGVPADPAAARTGFPTIPSPGTPGTTAGAPTGTTTTHIVGKGESLWGLARKYGTSVEAIQQANGMTGTNIMYGTTILVPTN